MVPSVVNILKKFSKIGRVESSLETNIESPVNLVRLCRSRTEFIAIVNEAIQSSNQDWDSELIQRVINHIFENKNSDISVYSSSTLDPFDKGHSFAVISEGISQENFRASKGKKRKLHCSRGSLIIPISLLSQTASYSFTPHNNRDFYPANNYHFDLVIHDLEQLAIALLDGINKKVITYSLLGNDGKFQGSYKLQAVIAYSHCLQTFGKLNDQHPPSAWQNGKTITASEQIETLKHLAETSSIDNPFPLS